VIFVLPLAGVLRPCFDRSLFSCAGRLMSVEVFPPSLLICVRDLLLIAGGRNFSPVWSSCTLPGVLGFTVRPGDSLFSFLVLILIANLPPSLWAPPFFFCLFAGNSIISHPGPTVETMRGSFSFYERIVHQVFFFFPVMRWSLVSPRRVRAMGLLRWS